jgi:2-dehydro-3-deoxy-D-arabinonate dehydratase
MLLTKHRFENGMRWAVDGRFLPSAMNLSMLLGLSQEKMHNLLEDASGGLPAFGPVEAPIDPSQEVWAAGVTYLRSRDARKAESALADMYQKVYEAERPEIFFKSLGWRVTGDGGPIRIRRDSGWNVPEPELVIVINCLGEIIGYCAGNDVSSRDIEGENPLYLPQAKVYNGSCALGHGILLRDPETMRAIPIRLEIQRGDEIVFHGEANTSSMKRTLPELVQYLTRELDFPQGVFLMTGTCVVPDDFTLQPDDIATVQVGETKIQNKVRW